MKKKFLSIILSLAMIVPMFSMRASGAFNMAFVDVRSTDWFYDGVDFVTSNDLFLGTSEGKFSPNRVMTRKEIITILYQYALRTENS